MVGIKGGNNFMFKREDGATVQIMASFILKMMICLLKQFL